MPFASGSAVDSRLSHVSDRMNTRRKILIALGAGALASPSVLYAQQQPKVWRIGFLQGGPRPGDGLPPVMFRKSLEELGYIQGKNIQYEGRWAAGNSARIPELAIELVQSHVDMIVTTGWPAAQA